MLTRLRASRDLGGVLGEQDGRNRRFDFRRKRQIEVGQALPSAARRKISCADRSKRSYANWLNWAACLPHPVQLIGETTLFPTSRHVPDFAVTSRQALVGFIEVKAPGKGADPRKFNDPHDKDQWDKLKSLPNLLYTDGNALSLSRDGKIEGEIVRLEGNVERSGSSSKRLTRSSRSLPASYNGRRSRPRPQSSLLRSARGYCRLLRDEVIEQMALGSPALTGLAQDWRKLLFPQADDAQFADGYAQAVTFGLLIARARDILFGTRPRRRPRRNCADAIR